MWSVHSGKGSAFKLNGNEPGISQATHTEENMLYANDRCGGTGSGVPGDECWTQVDNTAFASRRWESCLHGAAGPQKVGAIFPFTFDCCQLSSVLGSWEKGQRNLYYLMVWPEQVRVRRKQITALRDMKSSVTGHWSSILSLLLRGGRKGQSKILGQGAWTLCLGRK